MRLPGNYTAPRLELSEFLGAGLADLVSTKSEIMALVKARAADQWGPEIECDIVERNPGDDPLPDVAVACLVLSVARLLTIVASVRDPQNEVAVSALPPEVMGLGIGQRWYENVAFVVLPWRLSVLFRIT